MRVTFTGTYRKTQYVPLTAEQASSCLDELEKGTIRFKSLLSNAGILEAAVQTLCFGYLANLDGLDKSAEIRVPYRIQFEAETAKLNWKFSGSTASCGPQFPDSERQVRNYELVDYLPLGTEYFLLVDFEQLSEFQFECEGSGANEKISVFWEQYDLTLAEEKQPSLVNVVLTVESEHGILLHGQYPLENTSIATDAGAIQSLPRLCTFREGVFSTLDPQDLRASLR